MCDPSCEENGNGCVLKICRFMQIGVLVKVISGMIQGHQYNNNTTYEVYGFNSARFVCDFHRFNDWLNLSALVVRSRL